MSREKFTSSKFLHHEACPQCGSKDNLAVFDDGHKWCFGCHYFEPGQTSIKQVFNKEEISVKHTKEYPYDAANYIPSQALRWLVSCNISFEKQSKHYIQWSPRQQMVVWKIKNPEGQTLGWQGRCFNPDTKTKYISHGKIREDVCILGDNKDQLVLVEDYLSAINVSEVASAMPLFGCTCSLNALERAKDEFKQVVVWLDSDKLDNARKIASKASMLGIDSRVVYTTKDPKYYNTQEIKEILNVF